MTTTSISELRANLKHYVDSVIEYGESVLVNRGAKGAVLMSLDEYNSLQKTIQLLSSPQIVASFRRGVEEARSGKLIEINLDEL